MIGTILNHLYNDGRISPVRIAQIGQFAENQYFGKPCGLMDQLAIAVGGMLEIDFKAQEPKIIETDFNQEKANFEIIIVDTGGNHADLTHNYAAIPEEMKAVASQFDKESCRELDMPVVLANISILRDKVGDRAILRCLHFLNENGRVDQLAETIARNDYDQFLRIIKQSGNSSFKYLQNCYPEQEPEDQGISLALALTEHFIRKNNCRGACRVHGGGFAGTIQAFIEREYTDEYIGFMENIFGGNSLTKVRIRDAGSMKIN
jgi:galactokinase